MVINPLSGNAPMCTPPDDFTRQGESSATQCRQCNKDWTGVTIFSNDAFSPHFDALFSCLHSPLPPIITCWGMTPYLMTSIVTYQDSWFGVLHHVCGEHEWADGECDHGPLVEEEGGKTMLPKNSKAMEAIRKVVIDPRFLSTLQHYVTFRQFMLYYIIF